MSAGTIERTDSAVDPVNELVAAAMQQQVAELLSSDSLVERMQTKLQETVQRAVDEALSSFSDVGKTIQTAVKQSLQVDARHLSLPSYNATVCEIVRRRMTHILNEQGRAKLEHDLDKLFATAPETIRLSELVESLKSDQDVEQHFDQQCTMIIEHGDYCLDWISLDADEGKKKYDCDYRIAVVKAVDDEAGKVSSVRFTDREYSKDKFPLFAGEFYGFERLLFNLYACGSRLIIDETLCDVCYPGC